MEFRPKTYRISAPAMHTASTILRHFTIQEKPLSKIEATRNNMATLIDYATNMPNLYAKLHEFRREVDYLVMQGPEFDLARSVDRIRHHIRELEKVHEETFEEAGGVARRPSDLSEPAWIAARALDNAFVFTRSRMGKMAYTVHNIAILVDVCSDVFRAQDAVFRLAKKLPWQDPGEFRQHFKQVRSVAAEVDYVARHMAVFDEPQENKVVVKTGPSAPELSYKQKARLKRVQKVFGQVKTVKEEQAAVDHFFRKGGS